MRHLGIDRAHIVGHSYGGTIGLQLALASPASVHSLALLEPALFVGASAGGYRASLLAAQARYREAGGAVILHEFLAARWPGYRQPFDALLPGALDQGASDAGTCFEHELPGLLAWRFGEAEANRVHQPTLSILGGENDAPGSRFTDTHQDLLSWLPNIEGAVLPGATHFLQAQDPAGVATILADFWRRHPMPDQ
jgi:pimeloyl-ACP methyl ester carboxylesterase